MFTQPPPARTSMAPISNVHIKCELVRETRASFEPQIPERAPGGTMHSESPIPAPSLCSVGACPVSGVLTGWEWAAAAPPGVKPASPAAQVVVRSVYCTLTAKPRHRRVR